MLLTRTRIKWWRLQILWMDFTGFYVDVLHKMVSNNMIKDVEVPLKSSGSVGKRRLHSEVYHDGADAVRQEGQVCAPRRARELATSSLQDFYEDEGIEQQTTVPYAHQNNGTAIAPSGLSSRSAAACFTMPSWTSASGLN
ncbi:unnamed protein product [Peronospora belbahrii]|uniref:Uncharacterized protein n=1 Tax=Peronospora belbahrii TaxID=622444 RepID=A0AAU9KM75_9STRA|nr:unnamed protein product [Peronospora belbahrii]